MQLEDVIRHARKKLLWTPGAATREVHDTVEHMLRHRDPFLFVEAVTAIDLEQRAARGKRKIAPNDPVFVGHFPGFPIYPGVLQLETMGQLGLCLLHYETPGATGPRDVRALKIHHAQFLAEVRPGDDLDIYATVIDSNEYTAVCAGQLVRGDTILSFAVMEVYLVDE